MKRGEVANRQAKGTDVTSRATASPLPRGGDDRDGIQPRSDSLQQGGPTLTLHFSFMNPMGLCFQEMPLSLTDASKFNRTSQKLLTPVQRSTFSVNQCSQQALVVVPFWVDCTASYPCCQGMTRTNARYPTPHVIPRALKVFLDPCDPDGRLRHLPRTACHQVSFVRTCLVGAKSKIS